MLVYIVLSRISPRLPLEGKLARKRLMRWKRSSLILFNNEIRIRHLIRAAQSAAHRLAAARSRHGSDSPPDCHSLPCRHCATLESFKGRLWRVSVFLLPQSLARQLPRRRSPHLTINLSNFTQTPQSASLTASRCGSVTSRL